MEPWCTLHLLMAQMKHSYAYRTKLELPKMEQAEDLEYCFHTQVQLQILISQAKISNFLAKNVFKSCKTCTENQCQIMGSWTIFNEEQCLSCHLHHEQTMVENVCSLSIQLKGEYKTSLCNQVVSLQPDHPGDFCTERGLWHTDGPLPKQEKRKKEKSAAMVSFIPSYHVSKPFFCQVCQIKI